MENFELEQRLLAHRAILAFLMVGQPNMDELFEGLTSVGDGAEDQTGVLGSATAFKNEVDKVAASARLLRQGQPPREK